MNGFERQGEPLTQISDAAHRGVQPKWLLPSDQIMKFLSSKNYYLKISTER